MPLIETLSVAEVLFIMSVMLFAYTLKGMAGFGSGLLAVPLLALVLPLTMVVPMLGLISYSGTMIQSFQLRKQVSWRDCLMVLPFSLPGVLLAIWVFETVELFLLNKILAIFIISYALISLLPEKQVVRDRRWAIPSGFFAGFVGALFGTGGPFYVLYLKIRRLDKTVFRATIAAIFLFDGAIRMSAYSYSGFYSREVLLLSLLSFPVLMAGLYAGHRLHLKISNHAFSNITSSILLFSGLLLFFK